MKDLYKTLELSKGASQSDLKSAYRKLAKKYHPDANKGDAEAEKKFKEISAAYSILGDEEKRSQYDAGVIDAEGVKQAQQDFYRAYDNNGGGFRSAFSSGGINIDDIFTEFFGNSRRKTRPSARPQAAKGADVSYSLRVSFEEAAKGLKRRVALGGKTLDVAIPPGAKDQQTLRLKGQGQPGQNGGPNGDAYIEIHVDSHTFFERKGDNVYVDVPITLNEAINGGPITVPTIGGKVKVKVPPLSSSGTLLRLKGKGIKGADQFARLQIHLPEKMDKKVEDALKAAAKKDAFDPRKEAGLY